MYNYVCIITEAHVFEIIDIYIITNYIQVYMNILIGLYMYIIFMFANACVKEHMCMRLCVRGVCVVCARVCVYVRTHVCVQINQMNVIHLR